MAIKADFFKAHAVAMFPPRTLAQVQASLEGAKKVGTDKALARLLARPYSNLTDEARAYVEQYNA